MKCYTVRYIKISIPECYPSDFPKNRTSPLSAYCLSCNLMNMQGIPFKIAAHFKEQLLKKLPIIFSKIIYFCFDGFCVFSTSEMSQKIIPLIADLVSDCPSLISS